MSVNRELLFSTLFDRLSAIPDFVFKSRLFKTYDDLPIDSQPALIMCKGQEEITTAKGMPPIWKLDGSIYLYCRNDFDTNVSPSIQLNNLIQKVEEAFERKPNEVTSPYASYTNDLDFTTTLGGLCISCTIFGRIVTDEGTLGNQAVALIPFEITTTA